MNTVTYERVESIKELAEKTDEEVYRMYASPNGEKFTISIVTPDGIRYQTEKKIAALDSQDFYEIHDELEDEGLETGEF